MLPHLDETGYTPTRFFFRRQKRHVVEIDEGNWILRLDGLMESPSSIRLDDLKALPPVEIPSTIACSAHHLQQTLIAHARWRGVRLSEMMQRAGVRPEARYVHLMAADGYSACLEIAVLEDAILAYEMNGEVLPPEHGYPVRLIAPGLFGSAMPKQIIQMVFAEMPIPSDSEFDRAEVGVIISIFTPRQREAVDGMIRIGGVAYAGKREITQIEVSIDDNPWMPVAFNPVARYAWTPWQIRWTPPAPGDYVIRARAMDSLGNTLDEAALPGIIVHVVR